jgi:DNA mismatch repair protein MutS2
MNAPQTQNGRAAEGYAHAEVALDYRSVLELVASKCLNDGARRIVLDLHPSGDPQWIAGRLEKVREARAYQLAAGNIPVADTSCRTWIDNASKNNDLIPPEGLLAVAALERETLALVRRFSTEQESYPGICGIVSRMAGHPELIKTIEAAVDPGLTLKDTASSKLASLRKSERTAKTDLRKLTDRLARRFGSPDYGTFLSGRYVLIIPRELFRKRDGIVHSTSHSGGSLYFEPFSLLEKNNALETSLVDQQVEEARILRELTDRILQHADELRNTMALWEELDALGATARFAADFDCVIPEVTTSGRLRLVRARHPLLEVSLRQEAQAHNLVPLDLELPADRRALVITGPNAGGKTVTLKTVGLLSLMFQSGLPVPAHEGTAMAIYERIFTDIGDEQSISSSLSTFTAHLRHLDAMCRSASSRSLCLIDEIGDGTDPEEGTALAIATLEKLLASDATVIVSTHFGKVKSFALKSEGVMNASMAFDDDLDRPLYKLVQGVAGRSRGLETARRLGFEHTVIERAESMVGKATFQLERLLSDLESSQLGLEAEREMISAQSDSLRKLIDSYREKEHDLATFREAHRDRVKREAEEILVQARKEIEMIVKRIRETGAEKAAIRAGHRRIEELFEEVRETRPPQKAVGVSAGDRVSLNPSGDPSGRVIEVQNGVALVEINGKKIKIKIENLYVVDDVPRQVPEVGVDIQSEPLRTTELDVRGDDRVEALEKLDKFLDQAVLSGVEEIMVIHGIGEGILLHAIRSRLESDPRVSTLRGGLSGEGGVGVTIVRLN